jgi:acetyl esterase/lipase
MHQKVIPILGMDVRHFAHGDPAAPILIYCHGNKRNICSCHRVIEFFRGFCSLVIFDYRGFGQSSDNLIDPYSPLSLADDAAKVITWVQANNISSKIFVYGHSLGAGVALLALPQLHRQLNGLILEGAFANMSGCLSYWNPLAWVLWMGVDGKYPNTSQIRKARCPVFLAHCANDFVVPFSESEKLSSLLHWARDRARGIFQLRGTHNAADYDAAYGSALNDFMIRS